MTTAANDTPRSDTPAPDEDLIRDFLRRHTKVSWENDQDIFATGAVSSLFAMQLVVFLEKTFGVTIGGAELRLDNFRTIGTMTALVDRLRTPAAGGGGD
ncbi:acyl carrier protein [Streptomyces sp. A012304]|uniref:acyl carrier protein n=1 Tax=Streptomyces sp. A012304 TaxID=375446 RepID=UPI00222F9003|nr:acyl carrier protein [Streptomyces sp. A012304]GKQ36211.1 hypothetical protein ALMP_27540 [Streptomyces sp. A012304]